MAITVIRLLNHYSILSQPQNKQSKKILPTSELMQTLVSNQSEEPKPNASFAITASLPIAKELRIKRDLEPTTKANRVFNSTLILAGLALPILVTPELIAISLPTMVIPGFLGLMQVGLFDEPTKHPPAIFHVLTGEVEHVNFECRSSKLLDHIQFAKSIIDYVQKTVLFSENHPQRSEAIRLNDDLLDVQSKIQSIDTAVDYVQETADDDAPLEKLENAARLAEKYSVGNCTEMSCVGFVYAQQLNNQRLRDGKEPISVYKVRIENGNHQFLVVGLTSKEIPDDRNWPLETVFCDSWSGSCYPASQRALYLKDFVKGIDIKGRRFAWIRPFNPSSQSLEITS
jgi:hypothetical protein